MSCEYNYFLIKKDNVGTECRMCDSMCSSCVDEIGCTKCKSGWDLVKNGKYGDCKVQDADNTAWYFLGSLLILGVIGLFINGYMKARKKHKNKKKKGNKKGKKKGKRDDLSEGLTSSEFNSGVDKEADHY